LVSDTLTGFPDTKGHYADGHIQKLRAYKVVNGYEDGTFRPDNPVTRGEFAVIAANALENACGYALKPTYVFSDIDGHYSADSVAKLTSCGMLSGYEDGTFRPAEHISRGQAAIITANLLLFCGVQPKDAVSTFPDTAGHYADKHIQMLIHYGVVNGYEDGTFRPDENVTRGQAAIMIANALTVVGK